MALSAPAHSDEEPATPLHSHLHVLGVVYNQAGDPVDFAKCKPLANGRALPLNAHHDNLHTGRAGEAQWNAGNAVLPVFPGLTPWRDCATLKELLRSGAL